MHLFAWLGELVVAEEEGALEAGAPFPLGVVRVFGSIRNAKRLVAEISGLAILV